MKKDLPGQLSIDISNLVNIGDSILITELELSNGVKLTENYGGTATLVFTTPPQKEIVEEKGIEKKEKNEGEKYGENVEEAKEKEEKK